jgi:hypothetical protein
MRFVVAVACRTAPVAAVGSVLSTQATLRDEGDEPDGEKHGTENNNADLKGHQPGQQRAGSREVFGNGGGAHEKTTLETTRVSPSNSYRVPVIRMMRFLR